MKQSIDIEGISILIDVPERVEHPIALRVDIKYIIAQIGLSEETMQEVQKFMDLEVKRIIRNFNNQFNLK